MENKTELKKWCLHQAYMIAQIDKGTPVLELADKIYEWVIKEK